MESRIPVKLASGSQNGILHQQKKRKKKVLLVWNRVQALMGSL